jgi:predicted membrane-bound spermidine synthase
MLPLTVLLAGMATLGIEMLAGRLLAPFFGTAQPIWAAVIGMTLLYLALGYHLGGRLADRRPDARLLYGLISLAGITTACVPLAARPILGLAQAAIAQLAVSGFLGALAGVLALFAAPVILLAMVSPFAVRLQLQRSHDRLSGAGATVGALSALSTLGSIAGTFLTALALIPAIGTARTTLLYAAGLALLGAAGRRDRWSLAVVVGVLTLATVTLGARSAVKQVACNGCQALAERESAYNYIQVAERQHPDYGRQHVLVLNEGLAIHSVYNTRFEQTGDARELLTGGGPWDYFVVTPYLYPQRDPASVRSMALLGAGAGTTAAQFLAVYGGNARVDAVEIDPAIIDLGRAYFGMRDSAVAPDHPNYHVAADDARAWLARSSQQYDIIGIDAYHQPYIPFHLTTIEFFELVRMHLTERGVAVVNAGLGPNGDDRLGQAIAATMRVVFPNVYIMETRRQGNQIIVGTNNAVGDGWANMRANYERLNNPTLRQVIEWVNISERPIDAHVEPMTDDRAPVEALIDALIYEQALNQNR